ncbi:MAG: ChaB family protein [Candidatus Algichlamydia australiensis]|nr:ChaB family protein [Chlamydiales bacterium]
MPYQKNSDLPDSVRHVLPAKAQEIYRKAFNNAWKQYDGDEELTHKVAWSAVKKSYQKNALGAWVQK